MATLRLFASIREAAATSSVEIEAPTVGEVVAEASRRFGPAFSELVPICRVWRNGEPAAADDRVDADDEIALLPPVSGG